jgi:hypothetical protein
MSTDDLVKTCARVALEAETNLARDRSRGTWDAEALAEEGVRAILDHFAALGMGEAEKALPCVAQAVCAYQSHGAVADELGICAVLVACEENIAPVFAAMAERARAAEAERDEAIASRNAKWEAAKRLSANETARADTAEARLSAAQAAATAFLAAYNRGPCRAEADALETFLRQDEGTAR